MLKKLFALPLYLKIVFGVFLGIAIGIVALQFDGGQFIRDWIRPWGQLFIRLLQLIAIPLVFLSLVKGITGLKDVATFSRLGVRTIAIYMGTTVVAVIIGITLGLLVRPGQLVDQSQIGLVAEGYEQVIAEKKIEAEKTQSEGPLNFLNEIVPDNIVGAMSTNSGMLQVVFFAIFFGIAALTVPREKVIPVFKVIDGLNDIILRMVNYIIRFAPYGVTALMATLVVDYGGNLSIFSALGLYALTVVGGMFLMMLVFYPLLIHFFSKLPIRRFIKVMRPVQLFAFTTSSSAVTLPLTMETVKRDLNVSEETSDFVLPVGTTINMDGTSCYQAIAILFIAQVLHIELGLQQILIVLLMTILSSIGTPAIPGGSYVILTMVLTSVGIPAEGLALILGIDRPLDMLRTSVNVTGDATVAVLVDQSSSGN